MVFKKRDPYGAVQHNVNTRMRRNGLDGGTIEKLQKINLVRFGHKRREAFSWDSQVHGAMTLRSQKPLSYSISFKSILISSFYLHLRLQTDLFVFYEIQTVLKIQATQDTNSTQDTGHSRYRRYSRYRQYSKYRPLKIQTVLKVHTVLKIQATQETGYPRYIHYSRYREYSRYRLPKTHTVFSIQTVFKIEAIQDTGYPRYIH